MQHVDLSEMCEEYSFNYRKFDDLHSAKVMNYLKGLDFDTILFLGYTGTISDSLIRRPPYGCVASYSSLLPEYAGHSPLCWTVLDGIGRSGLTFYKVSTRHPFGSIILKEDFPVSIADDAEKVFNQVCDLAEIMLEDLRLEIALGLGAQTPFDDTKITKFWSMLTSKDSQIVSWDAPCDEIVKKIRAHTYPHQGAWFMVGSTKIVAWKARQGKYMTSSPPGSLVYSDKNHYVLTTKTLDIDITKYTTV
jgi:methionyl-tRNA formyltransferase